MKRTARSPHRSQSAVEISTLPHGVLGGEERGRWEIAGLAITATVFDRVTCLAKHAHTCTTITVVTKGQYCETLSNGKVCAYPENSILVKPAGTVHCNAFKGRVECTTFDLDLDTLELPHRAEEQLKSYAAIEDVAITRLAWRAAAEIAGRDAFSGLALEGMALETISEASRAFAAARAHFSPSWLKIIRDVLEEAPTRVSLRDLANVVGLHPVYFARAFRRAFGCSVAQYARHRALERAARALQTTNTPIVQVSNSAGFADQSHFTRWFKRRYGVTPAQLRVESRR
jgi:AraC family transcriptional regulator